MKIVMVLSAKVDIQVKVKLLLGGAGDYMSKSFDPDEFLALVAALRRSPCIVFRLPFPAAARR